MFFPPPSKHVEDPFSDQVFEHVTTPETSSPVPLLHPKFIHVAPPAWNGPGYTFPLADDVHHDRQHDLDLAERKPPRCAKESPSNNST